MKNVFRYPAALLLLLTLNSQLAAASAQGTAFTYQGQLQNNGSPASGTYGLTFALFNTNATGTAIAGPVTNNAVAVTNGLFTTLVDFGPGVFTGATNWLQLGVAANGVSGFTLLSPRQQLTPTPYAIYAQGASNLLGTLPVAQLIGTIPLAQLPGAVVTNNNATSVNLSGTFSGNGGNLTSLNAAQLSSGVVPLAVLPGFQSSSNYSTVGGGQQNVIALISDHSVIGGGWNNTIGANDYEGTIAGGYYNTLSPAAAYATIGGGEYNTNGSSAGTIAGGQNNVASGQYQSAVGGGYGNTASANYATIAGGYGNTVSNQYAAIGGGLNNTASGIHAVVGGGSGNLATGTNATVAGGLDNLASTNEATVGGGRGNAANGGFQPTVAGGYENTASTNYAIVSGGRNNTNSGPSATIGGGGFNIASGAGAFIGGGGYDGSSYQGNVASGPASVISGGEANNASAGYAAIGGGNNNTNSSNAGTISGGQNNLSSGEYQSVVGGGYGNLATNSYATVPGGANNIAGGQFSFAAGNNAQALNQGAFVWADSQNAPFSSTAANQFNVRANGGVVFATSGAGMTLDGQPMLTTASFQSGGGSFAAGTDNLVDGPSMTIGGGSNNVAEFNAYGFSTIGGGQANTIGGDGATIGGGWYNTNYGFGATIGGGGYNIAIGQYATVGGGSANTIEGGDWATVGGGYANSAAGDAATVGGGENNQANNTWATVPGGYKNLAGGTFSFAAGFQAQALHQGAFVWADAEGTPFGSTTTNQFNVRANGGVRFVTSGAGITLDGQPVLTAASFQSEGGSFVAGTDNLVDGPSMTIGGGSNNVDEFNAYGFSTIGGGQANTIGGDGATIGGGWYNTNYGFGATIGGGGYNIAIGQYATVGGGSANTIEGGDWATVGGGYANSAAGDAATVGGGENNQANNTWATVPGGYKNLAGGTFSFAAGFQAQALHQGAFVWADSQSATFTSTTNDQFLIRAQGGVGIGTSTTIAGGFTLNTNMYLSGHALYLRGVDESGANQNDHNHGLAYCGPGVTNFAPAVLPDGPVLWGFTGGVLGVMNGGAHAVLSWTNGGVAVNGTVYANGVALTSDRNAKENFQPVDIETVLAKVAALPLTKWNYKTESERVQHIGPMAQDFQAAFGLDGADDKHISVVDEGGVALAAIQGLNQKLEAEMQAKDARIQEQAGEIAELKRSMAELKAMMQSLAARK